LLRAIGAGAATIAYDVNFNREVVGESATYFRTAAEVTAEIEAAEADDVDLRSRRYLARDIALRYDWDDVAERYQRLCAALVALPSRDRTVGGRARPSGRRFGIDTDAAPARRPAPRSIERVR
jgi:hypothetical protein